MNQAIKNLPKMSDICSTNKNRLAFSTFLSCITHSVMHSLLQIKDDKDSQIRFFASFVLQLEKTMNKLGVPVTVQPTAWQRQIDRMAEQCDIINDNKSIIVKEYGEDSEVNADFGVHIQPRMYETEKIDHYLDQVNSEISEMIHSNASTDSSPGAANLDASIEAEFKSFDIDDIKGES